ncbi:hypothetical protein M153_105840002, partial [Pseudoloma neurophilia]
SDHMIVLLLFLVYPLSKFVKEVSVSVIFGTNFLVDIAWAEKRS